MSSINHYFSSSSSEGQWWSHYPTIPAQTSSSSSHHPIISSSQQYSSNNTFWVAAPMLSAFDLNNNEDDDESTDEAPKERLFEKPLTPSDVGKLNRLVIPKQHAEKHFPLNAGAENGLLLGFEDEVGKSWRFRYSYWNSSQSYVLTKGWSRFVKEKRLDAGDIVVFARHRLDAGRFFIGWRRRQDPSAVGGWGRLFCSGHQTQSTSGPHDSAAATAPAAGGDGGGSSSSGQVQNPSLSLSSSGSGNSKTVRLFGVNLHATDHDSEPSTPLPHQQYYYPSNHHMDISFSGGAADADADVYHRQG